MLLVIHPDHPAPRKISRATELIRRGEIIAYPTDTGYGLGCDPFQRKTVERMFKILNLPDKKRASLLCSNFKQIAEYGYINDTAYRTARRIFPGPYTLILQATKAIPRPLHGKRKEVGIRVPNHQIILAMLENLQAPILNVTVRDTHGEYMDDPHEIEATYRKHVGAVIDADIIPENPSTVVDLTGDYPEIIRVGQGDPSIFL